MPTTDTTNFNQHFTVGRLLRYTWPTVAMTVTMSIYSMVDGLFVSNFTGTTAFAAINLVWPYVAVVSSIGFMFGAGGSALVAKTLGEESPSQGRGESSQRANQIFSMITEVVVISALFFTLLGVLTIRPVALALGASEEMLPICVEYGSVLLSCIAFGFLQFYFQNLMATAGKPKLGFWVMVAAGVTNIVFDALFIAVLGWGVRGVAIATAMGFAVGGLVPLVYFLLKNNSLLRLRLCRIEWRPIAKASSNGLSELMSNLCLPLVSMLYNLQLMAYIGESGVAVYGMIMYVGYIFIAIFLGFSIGSVPIIAYQFGARNSAELRSLLRKCLWLNFAGGVLMFLLSEAIIPTLNTLYFSYDESLCRLGTHAFRLFALCYVVAGVNIFISAWFTGLNNGLVSAACSFLRSALEAAAVLLLPLVLLTDGIWLSSLTAEVLAASIGAALLVGYRKKFTRK